MFAETLRDQQQITDKDIADVDMGVEKTPRWRQIGRDQRVLALAGQYRGGGVELRFVRGVRTTICELA